MSSSKPPDVNDKTERATIQSATEAPLFSKDFLDDGPPLILGSGKLAQLTKASVVGAMGDTVVLTTIAVDESSTSNDTSSFQNNFTVDFRQRHHGVGKIPLSAARRDNARPTDLETLGSRAIDRALRPLLNFNDNNNLNSIHIHTSVQGCSSTGGNPVVVAINSASSAMMSQGMLQEPVAAVSLGVVAGDGKHHPKVLVNPSPLFGMQQEHQENKINNNNNADLACELLYAGTRHQAVMAEFQYHRAIYEEEDGSFPTSIPEQELSQLFSLAHAAIQTLLDTQEEYVKHQNDNNDNDQEGTNDPLSAEERLLHARKEENELRSSLGLPPLAESIAEEEDSGGTSIDLQQKANELLQEATNICETQLQGATLALFGYKESGDHNLDTKPKTSYGLEYQRAFVHPRDAASSLLSKSMRGRREDIVFREVERVLSEWIASNPATDPEDTNALVSMLAPLVHKKLLQKALCTTAIQYGTRADQRFGGLGPSLNNGFRTIRPLSVTVPALPEVVHGSATFARGDTQVLCTVTLGAPREGMPNGDPFLPPLPSPTLTKASLQKQTKGQGEAGSSFHDLPVGSLRYLRTQEALVSDLNTRKSKADREITGDSGNLSEYRRAFLQYDFPSYSTGELPRGGGMHNRRAIGT